MMEVARRFVAFFETPQRRHEAEFIEAYRDRDLAVLRVEVSGMVGWQRDWMAPPGTMAVSDPVWFIGRNDDWYVPTGPSVGSVNRIRATSIIDLDIISISPGTSGAPVVTGGGIVGMVIRDDKHDNTAEVLSIEFVKRAFDEWEIYPWTHIVTFTDDKGIEYVQIPAGDFQMGSDDYYNEKPVHLVGISKPFYMSRYETTVGQYRMFVEATGHDVKAGCRDIRFYIVPGALY